MKQAHNPIFLSKQRLSLILSVLLLAALACSLPGRAVTPDTPTLQPTGEVTLPAPGPSPTPAGKPEEPAYGMDLFQKNIASNTWSEAQGLVLMMEYFTGQKTAKEVFGDQNVQDMEATGLVESVDAYLARHPDAPEAGQLTHLMAILIPDPENLEKYARPAESAADSGAVVPVSFRQPSAAADEVCATLWAGGFPTPQPGEPPAICLLYKTFQVLGKTYRIFYPKDLSGSAATPTNIEWASEAMTLAAQTYKTFDGNSLPDTDLIYGVPASSPAYATASLNRNGKCRIHAYPSISDWDEPRFKQIIAHEVFHCYQAAFLKQAYSAPFDQRKWWLEGSAEYFSNLVYPLANEEYRFIKELDQLSNTTSLFDLSYQNAFFFLFMAGKVGGPEAVLSILESFPASGAREDYAATLLKKIPDLQNFFQEYGQAYLDGTIQDSGGGAVPFKPKPGNPATILGSGSLPFSTKSFTLTRFALNYSGGNITQVTGNSAGNGLGLARLRSAPGSWAPLPNEVIAKCAEQDYVYLLTTTGLETYISRLDFTTDPQNTECDQCLYGKWKLDPESFNNYLKAALPSTLKGVASSAELSLSFTTTGSMDARYDPVEIEVTVEQPDLNNQALETTINLEISGITTADFSTQDGYIYLSDSRPNLEITTLLNGQQIDSNMLDSSTTGVWNTFAPVDQYTCSGNNLSLTPQLDKTVPALLFTREK